MAHTKHVKPGTYETYEIPAFKSVRTEMAMIVRHGGQIVSSAPTGAGYVLQVFWRD